MEKETDNGGIGYRALARKWRPVTFNELLGQKHITVTLKNSIKAGRIYSAYLFTGPRGVGKTSAARILSKALNCDRGPAPEPCNRCRPCTEIASGQGVDVIEIDGASNNSVEDVRRIRDNVKYSPSYFRYKIYIIDEVHMLSVSAFNALLKTLEEPPPHVVFIFATTEPHRIPPTIEDRCQRFDFKRIPSKVMIQKLKEICHSEGFTISDESLLAMALQAEGSLRDAEALLDQLVSYAGKEITHRDVVEVLGLFDRGILLGLLEAMVERDMDGAVKMIRSILEGGYDLNIFFKEVLKSIRNLIFIRVLKDATPYLDLTGEEIETLSNISKRASLEELERFFSIFSSCYDSATRSEFPELFLEIALIRAIRIPPVPSLEESLFKINEIQKRLFTLNLMPEGYRREIFETMIMKGGGKRGELHLGIDDEEEGEEPSRPAPSPSTPQPADPLPEKEEKPPIAPPPPPPPAAKLKGVAKVERERGSRPGRGEARGERGRGVPAIRAKGQVGPAEPERGEEGAGKVEIKDEEERKRILDSAPLQLFQGIFETEVSSIKMIKKGEKAGGMKGGERGF